MGIMENFSKCLRIAAEAGATAPPTFFGASLRELRLAPVAKGWATKALSYTVNFFDSPFLPLQP